MKQVTCCENQTACGLKKIFWYLGGFLFLIGLYGWIDRLWYGHLHANYGNVVTWGLWVSLYIYFIGLSAGSFLISSLVYVFNFKQFERIGWVALLTAIITLLMALFSIWVDLGHMERAWKVMIFANFKSPMAWMIWLYSAYFLLLLVETWFLLRGDLVRQASLSGLPGRVFHFLSFGSPAPSEITQKRDLKIVRILATIGVPVAVMFHGGVGALFGVVAARPHWHSGLFPILFLLSALVSGGALLIVVTSIFQKGFEANRDTIFALGKLVLGLLLLDLLFQFSEILVAFYGGIPSHVEGLKLALFGPYAWVFWVWQIGIGTVIPVILLTTKTRHQVGWVALAGLLLVIGFIGMRLNIVIPGLAVEEIKGLTTAYVSTRVATNYFPSVSEWLLSAGIVGFGVLLFGLGGLFLSKENKLTEDEV